MPNYTSNTVTIPGSPERIVEISTLLKTDKNVFDFNNVIPMPESLNLADGTITDIAIEYAELEKDSPKRKEILQDICFPYKIGTEYIIKELKSAEDLEQLGKMYLENQRQYGAKTWYDWCCKNWGTKWNSVDSSITEKAEDGTKISYQFETAWSEPGPVFFGIVKAVSRCKA